MQNWLMVTCIVITPAIFCFALIWIFWPRTESQGKIK